ncbi:MAG: hypothetical protein ACRDIY_21940, partial [Chloroflexota bacterium]
MTPVVPSLLALVVVAAWARPLGLNGLRALHILQLEEYQNARFGRWQIARPRTVVDAPCAATAGLATAAVALLPWPIWVIAIPVAAGVGLRQSLRMKRLEAKKPLVLTARASRLLAGWGICLILVALAVFLVARPRLGDAPSTLLALTVVCLFCWPLASLANVLLYPVEAGFRQFYLASARGVLRRYRPVVVGVAGSYGKTSTKAILAGLISSRYPA